MSGNPFAARLLRLLFLSSLLASSLSAPAATPLVWKTGVGYRFAPLLVPTHGQTGFARLNPIETGIAFSNHLSAEGVARNRLLEIGSGVALGDVDGDGRVDIYFCRLEGDNVLYRNLGDWKFEDITASAGVACPNQFSTGCALVDIDGDGDLDLLVNSLGGGTRALANDGHGRFSEMTNSSLQRLFGATSLALADVDGDGDLDLYVCNYRTDTFFDSPPGLVMGSRQQPDGSTIVEPSQRFLTLTNSAGSLEVVEKGEPDFFYLNRGAGVFALARWDSGVFRDESDRPLTQPPTDWGLSVMFRDLNGDGLPDLYVCNDFVHWPDRIWLNQGGRQFRAASSHAFRNVSLASMAVDVADVNRDGYDDIFVADMLSQHRRFRAWQRPDTLKGTIRSPVEDPNFRPEVTRNTLQLARGDGTFAEIAQFAGVFATDWTWSAVFLDVDLDGWEDLLVSTGANHDVQDADALPEIGRVVGWKTQEARLKAFGMLPRREVPSMAFRNRRDLTFEDVSTRWGFDAVGVAQGMALADLDNDGDLDAVINCLNAPARIYRNLSPAPRLAVRLKGAGQNTRGIGARIKVRGGPVTQTQEMIAGGRYLSSDDPMRVFATGTAAQLEIEVTWRSGRRSGVKDARPNFLYEIEENASALNPPSSPAVVVPLFEDVSAQLNHFHLDSPFDDFARQPLLPRKLSSLGPGVCWVDVNGDGFDDLIVGGGKDGRAEILFNRGNGQQTEWTHAPLTQSNLRDQTSILSFPGRDAALRLLVGESNWEDADTNAPPFRVFAPGGGAVSPAGLSSSASATGPLALADVDGDGDLDLFVGGRAMAGRYPEPATSDLLRNDGDSFQFLQRFQNLGLVSGATFIDFDGDGDPDLALACEWDSVRLFRNDHGRYTEVSSAMGLAPYTGWWNGIGVGDFDGDGRLDLLASNWGRNWRIDSPPTPTTPVHLFYGDFANNGAIQILIASLDPDLSKITPWTERRRMIDAIPSIGVDWTTDHAYGRASVQELLGDLFQTAHPLQATTPDSMVFLNRGDHFEAHPLPMEAQFAPAFGVSVADFDGDGNDDVFLAQNFFGVDAETSRHDAGVGLVLLGDGHGGFRALTPRESGVSIRGEQRGSAVADFDGDGRMDLVVAEHAGRTRLLRNQSGMPGVRVRLRGPKGNPDAVGAMVRLRYGDRVSRALEIHAGGGYWSQDSATLVWAASTFPSAVLVRWPGGQTQDWQWPSGIRSIEVSPTGVQLR